MSSFAPLQSPASPQPQTQPESQSEFQYSRDFMLGLYRPGQPAPASFEPHPEVALVETAAVQPMAFQEVSTEESNVCVLVVVVVVVVVVGGGGGVSCCSHSPHAHSHCPLSRSPTLSVCLSVSLPPMPHLYPTTRAFKDIRHRLRQQ